MIEAKVGRPADCVSDGGLKKICKYDQISTDLGRVTEAITNEGNGVISKHNCITCRTELDVISKGVGIISVLSTPEPEEYM
jgi:hypothetical protein